MKDFQDKEKITIDLLPEKYSKEPQEIKWRFINLIVFILNHIIAGIQFTFLPSISYQLQIAFDIKIEEIQYSSSLLVGVSAIITIINIFLIKKLGLKLSNLFFTFMLILGSISKLYLHKSIIFLFLNQVFIGIAQPFLFNTQMLFFENWFLPNNISDYFPYVASAGFIGNGLGAWFPFIIIDQNETDKIILQQQYLEMCKIILIISIINFLMSLFLFRNKSPNFTKNEKSYNFEVFIEDLKEIFSNSRIYKYCLIIAIGRGTILILFANFIIFFKKLNYPEYQGSLVLESFLVFGLLGSFIFNKYLIHKNQNKKYLIIFTFSGLLLLVLSFIFYTQDLKIYMLILLSFSGFFLMNKIPFVYSITMKTIKTRNINLLNVLLFLSSLLFFILVQFFLGVEMKKENGGMIFFYYLMIVYVLLLILILILKI